MGSFRSKGRLVTTFQGEAEIERNTVYIPLVLLVTYKGRRSLLKCGRNAEGKRAVIWLWVEAGDRGELMTVREGSP